MTRGRRGRPGPRGGAGPQAGPAPEAGLGSSEGSRAAPRERSRLGARDVGRELLPGQEPALLRALGLANQRGDVPADALRKLKQVNHLLRLLAPALDDAFARHADPVVVDAAAGNAYLGLMLAALWAGPEGRGRVVCVEPRADLAARVRARAAEVGAGRLEVVEAPLAAAALPERIHVLAALHACDTATDDALAVAVLGRAEHVAVVPCCQAEVARQLRARPGAGPLAGLWRHPHHARELGAHLTNAARALALEARGYQATVTELVGWEHAVKNELLLGRRVAGRGPARARRDLAALLAALPARPAVVDLLGLGDLAPAPGEAPRADDAPDGDDRGAPPCDDDDAPDRDAGDAPDGDDREAPSGAGAG